MPPSLLVLGISPAQFMGTNSVQGSLLSTDAILNGEPTYWNPSLLLTAASLLMKSQALRPEIETGPFSLDVVRKARTELESRRKALETGGMSSSLKLTGKVLHGSHRERSQAPSQNCLTPREKSVPSRGYQGALVEGGGRDPKPARRSERRHRLGRDFERSWSDRSGLHRAMEHSCRERGLRRKGHGGG